MKSGWRRLRPVALRILSTLAGLLGELSDQNAYRRHLAACGRRHSPEEWRFFSERRFRAKFQRPKCC